jgi:hypothetical protein
MTRDQAANHPLTAHLAQQHSGMMAGLAAARVQLNL